MADETFPPCVPGPDGRLDCSQAFNRLLDYFNEQLPDDDTELIRQHIETCQQCSEELGVQTKVRDLVQRCCPEPAPAELHQRIRQQILRLNVRTQAQG